MLDFFDYLSNSHPEALASVNQITDKRLLFIQGNIRDRPHMEAALRQSAARAVIHFAGLKSVDQSVKHPLCYQNNNVTGTVYWLQWISSALLMPTDN